MAFKNVLTIAGSDPSGGAGIQADLKTFCSLGIYGASVITCLTVQNTREVSESLILEGKFVKSQLEAVLNDIDIAFIKVGMLGDADIAKAVGEMIKDYYVICDPVMISKSGYSLLEEKAEKALKEQIISRSEILTPNYYELMKLTGKKTEEPLEAAKILMEDFTNLKALLVKGGHIDPDSEEVTDTLFVRDSVGLKNYSFSHQRFPAENTHGTGCTLSSAITAYLARNNDLVHSVEMAIDYVINLIEISSKDKIGNGNGPLHHHTGIKL